MSDAQQPTVQRKSLFPTGAIPKGRQTWIMLAVAVLIVAGVVFSGSSSPPPVKGSEKSAPPPRTVTFEEVTRARVQLDEETERLRQAQAQAKAAREELEQTRGLAPVPDRPGYSGPAPGSPPTYFPREHYEPPVKPVDAIAADRAKHEYTSLFASNIALTYRIPPKPEAPPAPIREPQVKEPAPPAESVKREAPAAAPRGHKLPRGSIIETSLQNQLDGSFSGPVSTLVTIDVWSHDRQHLLIPKGTRVLGESERVQQWDQQRLAVTFDRFDLPNGDSVNLEEAIGLDQIGSTALKDKVNNHYLAKFATSVALGAIAGLSLYGTGGYMTADGGDLYRQSVAQRLGQDSGRLFERQMNRMPTITIRPGTRVKIWLAKDIYLPEYGRARHAGVN